jgi:hypothetical protein
VISEEVTTTSELVTGEVPQGRQPKVLTATSSRRRTVARLGTKALSEELNQLLQGRTGGIAKSVRDVDGTADWRFVRLGPVNAHTFVDGRIEIA